MAEKVLSPQKSNVFELEDTKPESLFRSNNSHSTVWGDIYMSTKNPGINRRIELQSHSEIAQDESLNSRIKYIDDKVFKILTPLDGEGNPLDIPRGTSVTVYIPNGDAKKQSYFTKALDQETNDTTGERFLVLAQPEDGRIDKRDYVRVEVTLPVSIKVEYNDTPYKGTAINLSASGMLILLKDENDEIPVGVRVNVDLNLDGQFFKLDGSVTRKSKHHEGTDNYQLAIKFHIEDASIQDDIMGYVLSRQIELKGKGLLDEVEVPLQEQIELLKEEVARLRGELELAHKRETQAAESRQMADEIILQLTKQADEQAKRMNELQRWKNGHRWWKFWHWVE